MRDKLEMGLKQPQLEEFWCNLVEANSDYKVLPDKSKLIQDGFNKIFLIQTTDTKYILRASRFERSIPTTKEDYLFELEVLEYLKSKDFPVAYPIKWENNSYLLESQDYYCSLFSFAEGKMIVPMDDQQHYNFGKTLAELHQHLLEFTSTHTRYSWDIQNAILRPVTQFETFLGNTLKEELKELSLIKTWLINKLSQYESESKAPKGLVHGDPHNANVHFKEDNSFTLFDFDFLGETFLAFDVACLIGTERWVTKIFAVDKYENLAFNTFIEGYNSVRQLSKTELAMLPLLEIMRWIILIGAWSEFLTKRGDELFEGKTLRELLLKRIDTLLLHLQELQLLVTSKDYDYFDSKFCKCQSSG